MIKKVNKTSEFKHFKKLAKEWWDPNGQFKILHELTPIRIRYIKNIISLNNKKTKDNRFPLKKIDILELGGGGCLICVPLSRLGANITGLDFIAENIEFIVNFMDNLFKSHSALSRYQIS